MKNELKRKMIQKSAEQVSTGLPAGTKAFACTIIQATKKFKIFL